MPRRDRQYPGERDVSTVTVGPMLTGEYILRKDHGRYYANERFEPRMITRRRDTGGSSCQRGRPGKSPVPGPTASKAEIVQRALEMLPNNCPFDVTGTD